MLVDLSVTNFRSFKTEQLLSMNVEYARQHHQSNYSLVEEDRLAVLRTAAIFGPNASGKTNILMALMALRWIVLNSDGRSEDRPIPPYEPYRLSDETSDSPVRIEIEFIVGSGVRYRYEVAYARDRIVSEYLYSYTRRSKALLFGRDESDTWRSIKFGGTYKGGSRRFSHFSNAAYLSRAGRDPSAPESVREIYKYFEAITLLPSGRNFFSWAPLREPATLSAVSELIRLADTGVERITIEDRDAPEDIKLPPDMPEDIREAILSRNRMIASFWVGSDTGSLVPFEDREMSDGTTRLFEILPVVLESLSSGGILVCDELDAHFHTDIVDLILRLFHDDDINTKGAQLIFTTHDTNILDSSLLRRDQIWFVSKEKGASTLRSLDEYDKKLVRHDSPFEAFYLDGRLGALPRISYSKVKRTVLEALSK